MRNNHVADTMEEQSAIAEHSEVSYGPSEEEEGDSLNAEIKEEELSNEIYYLDNAGNHYQTLDSSGNVCQTIEPSGMFGDFQLDPRQERPPQMGVQVAVIKDEEIAHFVKTKADPSGKNVKVWECGICRKEFGHQYILMRHLPTHTDERKFECKECGKAFRQMSTLSQHRAIHSKLRPYVCEICQKTFNRVSTLISHRKTHTGLKPHRCHLCNKAFHQKGNLRNHIFTHTNERPYKCDVCQKGFNQMSNLMCHKFKAHQRADKPKYGCPTCGKEFEKRIALRNHEQYEHGEVSQSEAPPPAQDVASATAPAALPTADKPSVKYTNGVVVSKINTEAMQHAMAANQVPFALLNPIDGIPVLVRILSAGDKHMLVPATAEDLKRHGDVSLLRDASTNSSSEDSKMHIKIPVVANVVQRRREGGVCMDIVAPGPLGIEEAQQVSASLGETGKGSVVTLDLRPTEAPAKSRPASHDYNYGQVRPNLIDVDCSPMQMFAHRHFLPYTSSPLGPLPNVDLLDFAATPNSAPESNPRPLFAPACDGSDLPIIIE